MRSLLTVVSLSSVLCWLLLANAVRAWHTWSDVCLVVRQCRQ